MSIKQIANDNAVQVAGNKNKIFCFFNTNNTSNIYTIISSVVEDIVNNVPLNEEMDIEKLPYEIIKKIDYNDIKEYKSLFLDYSMYLDRLEYIIETTYKVNSQIIINRVKGAWCFISASNKDKSSDEKIALLNKFLIDKISKKTIKKYGLERIEIATELITFYAFTKCQILNSPLDD